MEQWSIIMLECSFPHIASSAGAFSLSALDASSGRLAKYSKVASLPKRQRMKRTIILSADICRGNFLSVIPSPGAVWPAMVILFLLTFNVDFNVMDPVLDSYRFTGTFNNRQLSQILDYLRISSRIDYSIKRMEMDDSLSAQREQIVLRRIK